MDESDRTEVANAFDHVLHIEHVEALPEWLDVIDAREELDRRYPAERAALHATDEVASAPYHRYLAFVQ
jgi:hypothetical protein